MAEFQVFDPRTQVSGSSMLAVVRSLEGFSTSRLRILEKHGIVNPQEGEWYSLQNFLDAFKEILTNIGPKTVKLIGKKAIELVPWPPTVNTIESALSTIDIAYKMNHRGGDFGYYRYEKLTPTSVSIECCNPYPCLFDEGMIETIARKFAAQPAAVKIQHKPGTCRQQGDKVCIFQVSWKE